MALILPQNGSTVSTLERVDHPTVGTRSLAAEDGAWSRLLAIARVGCDLLAVSLAMIAAFRFKTVLPGRDPAGTANRHLLVGMISLPIWAIMLVRGRLYSGPHIAGRLDEMRRLIQAEVRSLGVVVIAAFLLRLYVLRSWIVLSGILAFVLIGTERELIRWYLGRRRKKGQFLRRVVIVGGNLEAIGLCSMLVEAPEFGYAPVGFVDDEAMLGTELLGGHPVLGRVDETCEIARMLGATAVVIATTAVDQDTTNRLIRQLATKDFQVELSSSLRDIAPTRLLLRPLGRFPVVYVDPVRHDGWGMRAKRAFDIMVASIVGLIAAPLLAIAAIAIKLSSAGPVHFRQSRVGKNGAPFEVLKLRTMVLDAESMVEGLRQRNQADGPLFKLKGDPRITRVGRILRSLSIDELPQLWNVLKGQMSLVGPRPALPKEVDLWSADLHGRLAVKPGMTGMWQVSGGRRWHSFDEYARLDLYYVDNWCIWTDLAILAKTIPAVLFGRGQS